MTIVNSTTTGAAGDEDSTFLGAVTQAEVVIIAAVSVVVILAVVAVILRIIMPMIRKKHSKEEDTVMPRPIVEESTGKLLAPGTPSSSRSTSSHSSFARSSFHGDWSDASSYRTKSTYVSQNSLHPGKSMPFGNLRPYSGNASPASYRSKITQGLNEDLISMISQQSCVLEPLNLSEQYKTNWDTHGADSQSNEKHNLGFSASPMEPFTLPERNNTLPFRHHDIPKSTIIEAKQIPSSDISVFMAHL